LISGIFDYEQELVLCSGELKAVNLMAEEKYLVAAAENSFHVAVRNILNPNGYVFLDSCSDGVSLMRLIRSYHPDFVVIDMNIKMGDISNALDAIENDMLCACIIVGENKSVNALDLLENFKLVSFCPKPLNPEILLHTVELANVNYKRIRDLSIKLSKVTESYETRKQVEKAKRILMERKGLSEKAAYEEIRKKSMDRRMPMKSIAEAIINSNMIGKK
jgi:AmiR/NasT family two-component response regulator